MPFIPISEADLKSFKEDLSQSNKSAAELFSTLKNLKNGFKINESELVKLKYNSAKKRLEKDYLLKKEHWDAEIQDLKKQFKQLDNRIVAAEQKLKNGIPEDLNIMEKLIAEQESIVEDQEKLNTAETELIAHVRNIDIEYGKEQEKLKQLNTVAFSNNNESIEDESLIDIAEKRIKFRVSMISLIPILIIPLLADLFGKAIGFQQTNNTNHQLLSGHYLFFIALILTELFLAEKIKIRISRLLSIRYLQSSFAELQQSFTQNIKELNSINK